MILKATEVRYSSTVGGGLMLTSQDGVVRFQVAFLGSGRAGISKVQNDLLARQIKDLIDKAGGIEVPV